jgi:hypothetical protein
MEHLPCCCFGHLGVVLFLKQHMTGRVPAVNQPLVSVADILPLAIQHPAQSVVEGVRQYRGVQDVVGICAHEDPGDEAVVADLERLLTDAVG